MSRKYTYEEVRGFIVDELRKSKHIMNWITLGSRNIERDLDTVITKDPSSPTDKFYEEIHSIMDNLNRYLLKKYGARVIRFSSFEKEELKLADFKKNDLAIQTMVYCSHGQLKKDWGWALRKGDSIKGIVGTGDFLKGKLSDLFSWKFRRLHYVDSLYIYLTHYDRINSGYPSKFLVEVMNSYFYYFEKRIGVKIPRAKSEKEVRKIFYGLCRKLDGMRE